MKGLFTTILLLPSPEQHWSSLKVHGGLLVKNINGGGHLFIYCEERLNTAGDTPSTDGALQVIRVFDKFLDHYSDGFEVEVSEKLFQLGMDALAANEALQQNGISEFTSLVPQCSISAAATPAPDQEPRKRLLRELDFVNLENFVDLWVSD
jgi:hypothetical protein